MSARPPSLSGDGRYTKLIIFGRTSSPAGDNSQILSPHPAITVPTDFSYNQWPAGMTFLGRWFAEPQLIRFTYAYEQATRRRRPPAGFGE